MSKHYINSYEELNKAFYEQNKCIFVDHPTVKGSYQTVHVTSLNYKDAQAFKRYYHVYTPETWKNSFNPDANKFAYEKALAFVSPEDFRKKGGLCISGTNELFGRNWCEFDDVKGRIYTIGVN